MSFLASKSAKAPRWGEAARTGGALASASWLLRPATLAAALALPASAVQAEVLADPAADLAAALPVCVESLRTGDNPPVDAGWRPATHMSGTPFGMASMKSGNLPLMMEAMAHSRETFVLAEKHVTLTQYYRRGAYVACGISGDVAATNQADLAQALTASMEAEDGTGKQVAEMRKQYQLVSASGAYRINKFTLLVEPGTAATPDLFSLIVIKD